MRRRAFIAGVIAAFAAGSSPRAQPRRAQIGVLFPGSAAAMDRRMPPLREGVFASARAGEPDIDIVTRIADGNPARLPALAAELVKLGVRAILAVSPAAVRAAHNATATIPIVAHDLESDPIANGWAASIARPGGNVTGLFLDLPDVSVKCLQLLQEVVPAQKIAVLWDPTLGSLPVDAVRAAVATLGIGAEFVEMEDLEVLDGIFRALSRNLVGGVLMLSSPIVGTNPQRVADLALAHKLPAITLFAEFAQSGGLLAYGPDAAAMYRQAGILVRKVVQGERPAEIPIERPARFVLAVNLKAAKAIGVGVPTSILVRADEVIE
ncbi:MAG TPA: ABC transporter substrate-binding protein [Sphingomicrobium sp.]|nr:ABC transporter substrate-binding protein [Sphingomicrobium sp.]